MQPSLIGRLTDLEYIRRCASEGTCCSIVAVSNLGKSLLLRHACTPSPNAPESGAYIYVDCNQMPERTGRAFFATVWRALAGTLQNRIQTDDLRTEMQHVYEEMTNAASMTSAVLHFEQGVALALGHLPRPIVLCLDDFDEAFQYLEPQTYLNLRALKDRCGDALVYVTATERELARLAKTREQGEFYELIIPNVRFLDFWRQEDSYLFCESFAQRVHVTFSENDLAFIWENAGGHPGLTQVVCYVLGMTTGAPVRDDSQDRVIHQLVKVDLSADENIRIECDKIWDDLDTNERDALFHFHSGSGVSIDLSDGAQRSLRNKHLVVDGDEGPRIFCKLFQDFVRQQKLRHQPSQRGIYVDVDAGEVWVDGKPLAELTELEYRLILFLYGRLDRVCDKYSIVQAVWGENYVDQVDDTRIEKLISRVRQKIEPDPSHPRYLTSLRGRGYKLVR